MVQVSKPCSTNHSIAEECARPVTCRSKVGCEAIDEPCTNRIVPRFALPECLRQRKSLTSPLRVQCSVPFIVGGVSLRSRTVIVQESPGFYQEELDEPRHRGAGHISQTAPAPLQGAARAAGDPREGSRHLADVDLEAIRRGSAPPRLRASR